LNFEVDTRIGTPTPNASASPVSSFLSSSDKTIEQILDLTQTMRVSSSDDAVSSLEKYFQVLRPSMKLDNTQNANEDSLTLSLRRFLKEIATLVRFYCYFRFLMFIIIHLLFQASKSFASFEKYFERK
jgi:hypothetical protein